MQSKNTQTLVDQITALAEDEYLQNAKKITKDLGEMVNDDTTLPILPLNLFTKYFSKAFTGQEPMTAELRDKWIDIAKGSFQRVKVFDENKIVFIVPALLNPTNTESVINSRLRINDTIDEYANRSRNHPALGKNFLYTKLADIAGVASSKDDFEFTELQKQWKIIYDYYGVDFNNPGKLLNSSNQPVNNNSSSNLSTDDFIEM